MRGTRQALWPSDGVAGSGLTRYVDIYADSGRLLLSVVRAPTHEKQLKEITSSRWKSATIHLSEEHGIARELVR